MKLLLLLISSALVNNIVLVRFLGTCPFLGTSRQMKTAVSMGLATTFVLVGAGVVTWIVDRAVLVPMQLSYLRTLAFILVIAVFVQFVEMVIRKANQALYEAFGIYLALITTNCAVLGLALMASNKAYDLAETAVFGVGTGLGFTLALVLMAGIREELAYTRVPKAFEGTALALTIAGLLSLAFMGFSGMVPI
ncbi:electron transport complex subunit RsxA [Carboxydochorda subterranea]|uniref:Ion-translocating oxidoreductase complex subunit A n=1 Tax=Carboxydichorda subterranea TaxID=3109565 RepID=A0ABZ1C056_9FIRM|nr:electron transport complex subunit RsxA [Limnochorda sp. L945t]WRP18126.1 electron transport complex subunit RsxA [Limnochorda sp. L945t]